MNTYTLSILLSLTLLSCTTADPKREPAADLRYARPDGDGARLIVAEKTVSGSNDEKLLLIGIDQHNRFDSTAQLSVDISNEFKSIGGRNLTEVDPKFLMMVNRDGVKAVYAFNARKAKKNSDDQKEELPVNLVDNAKLKRRALLRTPVKDGLNYIGNLSNQIFKWGPVASLFDPSRGEREKSREASYLLQILDGAMFDQKYADLLQYFPVSSGGPSQQFPNVQLCDLGSMLSLRYHPTPLLAIPFASAANRIDLYCRSAVRLRDEAGLQEQALMKQLAGKHIHVDRITEHYSIVSYDPTLYIPDENWNGHGMQTASVEKMNATITKWLADSERGKKQKSELSQVFSGGMIPYAVISETSNSRYVTVAHFFETNRQRRESLFRDLYLALDATKTAFNLASPISIPLSIADDFFNVRMKQWRQSTFFEDTTIQYGRLMAFLQVADSFDFDWSQTSDAGWIALSTQKLNFSQSEIDSYTKAISNHARMDLRNQAINDIVTRSLIVQSGTLFTSTGGKNETEDWTHARQVHWDRFSKWLQSGTSDHELRDMFVKWSIDDAAVSEAIINKNHKALLKAQVKVEADKIRDAEIAATLPAKACIENGKISTQCTDGSTELKGRPVILFAIDGLRPEYLEFMANQKMIDKGKQVDVMPNLKNYFLEHGLRFKSYTQHTVSIPSFATILTGFEPDVHGILAANSNSRNPKIKPRDYLDYIADNHFVAFANKESQGLARIHRAKLKWLGDYVDEGQKITSLAPIHEQKFVPLKETSVEIAKQGEALSYGVIEDYEGIDLGQADYVVNTIRKNPGQTRFIFNYYLSVDHVGHIHNGELDRALNVADSGIGRVLAAAKKDPVLKNALVLVVSDHGLYGGKEFADPMREEMPKNSFDLVNQNFNFAALLAGDFPEAPEYRFAVGSGEPCEDRQSVTNIGLYSPFSTYNLITSLRPATYDTCRSVRPDKNKGRSGYGRNRTLFWDIQGDGRATALVLDDAAHPARRKSYYELSHYSNPEMKTAYEHAVLKHLKTPSGNSWVPYRNMVDDLLQAKVSNFQSVKIQAAVEKLTKMHPVDVFAMPIQGQAEKTQLEALAGFGVNEHATREPILVQSLASNGSDVISAVIFIKDGSDVKDTQFRYVLFKNFKQLSDQNFAGEAMLNPTADSITLDPFHYRIGKAGLNPARWYSDREMLSILIKNEETTGVRDRRPNAITAIARTLSVNSNIKKSNPDYQEFLDSVIPDFAIFAAEAFNFNPAGHQADHGGLRTAEVRTTLMVTDLANPMKAKEISTPVLTRDITPTILDYLGIPNANQLTEGESLRPYLQAN